MERHFEAERPFSMVILYLVIALFHLEFFFILSLIPPDLPPARKAPYVLSVNLADENFATRRMARMRMPPPPVPGPCEDAEVVLDALEGVIIFPDFNY